MSQQFDVPAARLAPGSVARSSTERVVGEAVIAAVAAHAAVRTEGVVRLEPGVTGLLRQAAGRLTGGNAAPTAGVDVHYDGDIPVIHLDLVVSGARPVAEVGAAIQRAVAHAVIEGTDVPEPVITVSVLDIELGGRR
jgi:uncharacterized alkaline shock family protein YloU